MKKLVLLEIMLFSFLCSAVAQDTIKTKDGQDILSKVIEISNSEIKYKKIKFKISTRSLFYDRIAK